MMKSLPKCSPLKRTNNSSKSKRKDNLLLVNNRPSNKSISNSNKKLTPDCNSNKRIWGIYYKYVVGDSISCN
jgi:hypothetical protein